MAGSDVLVDATLRFSARDGMNFNTGIDEVSFIRKTLSEQPGRYYRYISACNKGLAETIHETIGPGMQTRFIAVVETSDDDIENYSTPINLDEDCGVHLYFDSKTAVGEQKNAHKKTSRLDLSTSAVDGMRKVLDPLYSSKIPEDKAPINHLEATVIASSWMALGRWTFDIMDPRELDKDLDDHSALRLLHGIAGVSRDECLEIDVETDRAKIDEIIDSAMLVLKYRFAGAMAYAGIVGLSEELSAVEAPQRPEIRLFQLTSRQRLLEIAKDNPDSITATDFALARSLRLKDAGRVIDFFMAS